MSIESMSTSSASIHCPTASFETNNNNNNANNNVNNHIVFGAVPKHHPNTHHARAVVQGLFGEAVLRARHRPGFDAVAWRGTLRYILHALESLGGLHDAATLTNLATTSVSALRIFDPAVANESVAWHYQNNVVVPASASDTSNNTATTARDDDEEEDDVGELFDIGFDYDLRREDKNEIDNNNINNEPKEVDEACVVDGDDDEDTAGRTTTSTASTSSVSPKSPRSLDEDISNNNNNNNQKTSPTCDDQDE
eukprot:PhM_4_TR14409/c0_g1_i1/m.20657